MQCVNILVTLFALIIASSTTAIESSDFGENPILPRALYNTFGQKYGQSSIVTKIQCVVDTLEGIANDYNQQPKWQEMQHK